jgi:hypothetical protein
LPRKLETDPIAKEEVAIERGYQWSSWTTPTSR